MDYMSGNNSKMLYLFTLPKAFEKGRSVMLVFLCPMPPSSLKHSCPSTHGHQLVAGLTIAVPMSVFDNLSSVVNNKEAASSMPS